MRVCIVGAGASGLPAIKACLAEGFSVVCYERTSDIGGLWNYRPHQKIGGTVMRSTVVNTSKEMMAYSDFPPHEDLPNFMHHSLLLCYIREYADHFDLLRHIVFNTSVKMITPEDAGWRVELDKGRVERFDKILICSGHHSEPLHPQLRDVEKFKGEILHAHEYRDWTPFENKRIFIMGIGNSALDIAVDLAKVAKSVVISSRRGSWIFNRAALGAMPYDILYLNRAFEMAKKIVPWTVLNDYVEHKLTQRLDHDIYGLRPAHRFFQQHPTVNDALANLLCSGLVTITEDVESFSEGRVIVKGGRSYEADVFISCTGYSISYPFLKKGLLPVNSEEVSLYKYVFPPSRTDIALIGLVQPIGSIAPISEMQARLAVGVFSGRLKIPSEEEQKRDIQEKKASMHRKYYTSQRHTMQVDYMEYMDELAELVGCHPKPFEVLLKDWRLGLRLLLGPNAPFAYRLRGVDSWSGARDAIMKLPERVKKPMKHRQCRTRRHKRREFFEGWFRYASLKWLAGWSLLLIYSGCWVFTISPISALSPLTYFFLVLLFLILFIFLLMWFDMQYDMTTIF